MLIISFIGISLFLLGLLFPRPLKRSYQVFFPHEIIRFLSKDIETRELVDIYKPLIQQPVSLPGPPPTSILYEIIPSNEMHILFLIFRICWPDEIHPNAIFHWIYKVFRKFYYGSSKDIEIIQIKVNTITSEILEIKFESDPGNLASSTQISHRLMIFRKTINKKNKYISFIDRIEDKEVHLSFSELRLKIAVMSWNHLFTYRTLKEENYHTYSLPLYYLTDKEYTRFRFDRRSLLDFGIKGKIKFPFLIGGLLSLIGVLITLNLI